MNQQPPDLPKSKSKKLLVSVAVIIIAIITAVIGKDFGAYVVKSLFGRSNDTPMVQSHPAATWETRTLVDISIDAPFEFGPGPDISAELNQDVRDMLEYLHIYDSGDSTNPRVTVSRIAYKPAAQISLDGAVNGAMTGAAKPLAALAGVADPKYTAEITTIDGLPARRASYIGQVKDVTFHVDAAFAQSGQKLWQVQVISTGEAAAADARRFLDSIHIRD